MFHQTYLEFHLYPSVWQTQLTFHSLYTIEINDLFRVLLNEHFGLFKLRQGLPSVSWQVSVARSSFLSAQQGSGQKLYMEHSKGTESSARISLLCDALSSGRQLAKLSQGSPKCISSGFSCNMFSSLPYLMLYSYNDFQNGVCILISRGWNDFAHAK